MRALALVIVAACGDDLTPAGGFDIVGHSDLGARGMNAALAIADDTVYVGSRIDNVPIAIVDASDPTSPTVVGEIGAPDEGLSGMSSRELRAVPDANLLVVLNLKCDPMLHGCDAGEAEAENLKLYDITDRRAPKLASTYFVATDRFHPRSPHELYLWRSDTRVLILLSAPPGVPSYEVIDATDKAHPAQVATFDTVAAGLDHTGADNILHSVSASPDGKLVYVSHQTAGLVVLDQSAALDGSGPITMVTPPAHPLDFAPPSTVGPHSAVQVPGTHTLVVTEEVYPMPYGTGCPWGHARMVDATDPANLAIIGEYALPENDPAGCATNLAPFTSHNATALHDLALITWYAGGLQAVDISDPTHPVQAGELRPDPIPAVTTEDPGLGPQAGMWSYPIIKDGLVYVVDIRNGLYVLRYRGVYAAEVAGTRFAEGNSNL